MAQLSIVERLEKIAQGEHPDLADLVCRDAIAFIEAQSAQLEAMRRALEPFAARANAPKAETVPDDETVTFFMKDCRAARAAHHKPGSATGRE